MTDEQYALAILWLDSIPPQLNPPMHTDMTMIESIKQMIREHKDNPPKVKRK